MDIGFLRFRRANQADAALREVAEAQASKRPWLREVAVISRPLLGRICVRASRREDEQKRPPAVHEGDLSGEIAAIPDAIAAHGRAAALAPQGVAHGRVRRMMTKISAKAFASWAGKSLEKRALPINDIKQLLPRGSSGLILLAEPETIHEMVGLFDRWSPVLVQRSVRDELQGHLERVVERTRRDGTEAQPWSQV
jgi:hypothetical protein